MLKLSLIIPVYNEERHIKACLEHVATQTIIPDEVIVVDNNCTDNTINIAKSFPFVRIITEKNQGRANARSAGFNKASGDILGRIDADSRIDEDWVKTVLQSFTNDKYLYGLTGLGRTSVVPGVQTIKTKFFTRSYYWWVHANFNTITMWGANMAIQKKAWEEVKNDVILNDNMIHEDQDLSLWMAAKGLKIKQNNNLLITTNGQTYRYLPKLIRYSIMHFRTKKLHLNNNNLRNEKVPKIGYFKTLAGKILSIIPAIYLLFLGVILFPVDYYVTHYCKNSNWLD